MNDNQGMVSCAVGCWLVAALGGVLAAVLLWLLGGWTFVQGIFAAVVVVAVAGALLSWIMCRPLPALGSAEAGQKSESTAKADAARADAEARSAEAAASKKQVGVMPTKPLAGQAELAARKGEWKYEGEPKAAPATKAKAKAAPAEAPKAAPAEAPKAAAKAEPAPAEAPKAVAKPKAAPVEEPKSAEAADAGAGKKPKTLKAARKGGPDDLKQIKGVGPKLEALLHSMGFYHFDQLASWGADEVAWVDQNLEGFKGRVSRDEWVAQAKTLAAGGSTEFSNKVKKGNVY